MPLMKKLVPNIFPSTMADLKNTNEPLLHRVLKNENFEEVLKLLANGEDIEVRNTSGETTLLLACLYGLWDKAELLVFHGADIHAKNCEDVTPLHVAVGKGPSSMVQLLLRKGAEVNAATCKNATPLHIASEWRSSESARLLIFFGADIEAKNWQGMTPLHIAVKNGYAPMVKLLLSNGAEVNAVTNEDLTPLHIASSFGHMEIAKLLLSHEASVLKIARDGKTTLDVASTWTILALLFAYSMREQLAKHSLWMLAGNMFSRLKGVVLPALLSSLSDILFQNESQNLSLQKASEVGNLQRIQFLISQGTDVNARDDLGWTALQWASFDGHLEAIKVLVAHGACVNAADDTGRTPLHIAVFNGHLDIVDFLLSQNALVNEITDQGDTPLHVGAQTGYVDVIKLLCQHGADHNLKNKFGQTPEDLAVNEATKEAMTLACSIDEITSKRSLPLLKKRLLEGDDEIISAVLQNDPEKESLMHLAVKADDLEMVKILITCGFNLNAIGSVENEKLTPLMLALKHKNKELVEILIENGAKQLIEDNGCVYSAFEFAKLCGEQSLINILNGNKDSNTALKLDELSNLETKKDQVEKAKELFYLIKAKENDLGRCQNEMKNLKFVLSESKVRIDQLSKELQEAEKERDHIEDQLKELNQTKGNVFRELMRMRFSETFKTPAELKKLNKIIEAAKRIEEKMSKPENGPIEKDEDKASKECPICFERAARAHSCFRCQNWFCQKCNGQLRTCPHCRQNFSSRRPRRNKAIERALQL